MCFKLFRGLYLSNTLPLIWPGMFFETLVLKADQDEPFPNIEYLFEFTFNVEK